MELHTEQEISWLDDVDKEGNIINPRHELYGKNIAGSVLYMPAASGSTVGADRLVNLAVNKKAPAKIVLERQDPITMWGAILGKIDVEIKGKEKKAVDISKIEKLGIDPEIAELLSRAGELLGTDEFIPADFVQIAGVSYKTITETGLELRRYFGSKYKFRAKNVTINPSGMDMESWQEHGIPEEFAKKQKEIIDIYVKMGAVPTITCTPYLVGNTPPPFTDAFLSESSLDLYHISGITPEARYNMIKLDGIEETFEIDRKELDDLKERLNTGKEEDIDLVAIGCPHASINEVREVAMLLKGKHIKEGKQLWITTSRAVKDLSRRLGYLDIIENAGGHIVADACPVFSPIEDMGFKTTATNSGKAAKYLPRASKQNVVFASVEELISKIT